MNIEFLLLHDWRNYRHLELPLGPGVSLFSGRNASGKTNLLEACYYLSYLSSPRAERDLELASWGKPSFVLGCRIKHRDLTQTLRVEVAVTPSLRRRITVDDKAGKRQDLSSALPSVYFSPDDLYMVKRGSALRRRFLDSILSRLDPEYGRQLTRYQDAVTRRNVALKKSRGAGSWDKTLETLDDLTVRSGTMVLYGRLSSMDDLRKEVGETYTFMAGQDCQVSYESSVEMGDRIDPDGIASAFREALAKNRTQEKERGVTISGPHRDDLALSLGGRSVRHFGSQGEQRSAALALRIAEARMLERAYGRKPLLLLDDVFSELDQSRREKVLSLCDYGHQILITSTDPVDGVRQPYAAFHVEDARVSLRGGSLS